MTYRIPCLKDWQVCTLASNEISLLNAEARVRFQRDIVELEVFLKCRLEEMEGSTELGVKLLADAPEELQRNSNIQFIKSALQEVTLLLQALRDEELQKLLLIYTSDAYVAIIDMVVA